MMIQAEKIIHYSFLIIHSLWKLIQKLSQYQPALVLKKLILSFKTIFMQPEMILKSDVLDILFENRNKAYGAYELRRGYDNRVRNALLFTFSLITLFLFGFTKLNKSVPVNKPIIWDNTTVTLKEAPHFKDPSSGSQKKRTVQPVAANDPQNKPRIVEDKTIAKAPDVVKPTDDNKVTIAGSTTSNVKQGIATDGDGDNGITGDGKGTNKTATDITSEQGPVMNPDINAQFPGGMNALRKFLEKNMATPDIDAGETVEVQARFIVNADGKVTGVEIIQSGGDECDNDALKALSKMPDWEPARMKGHNVATYFIIPIHFVGTGS
jgi:periplasmic protein TonB